MKKIFVFLFILFVLQASCFAQEVVKEGSFYKAKCSCTCRGAGLEATSLYNPGLGEIPQVAGINALGKCQEQCARICGGYTTCIMKDDKGCKTCCSDYCGKEYVGGAKEPCEQSCRSTCSYKGMITGITEIIYEVAGIIAALMIVIHGIRLATAQDAADRNAAKNSIVYVILALIIIVLAGSLVNLFLGSVSVPDGGGGGGGVTPVDCSDCGGNPSSCTAASCHGVWGCWYKASSCVACAGSVSACSDYDLLECGFNACGIASGCEVVSGQCVPAQTQPMDCSICGPAGSCTLDECLALKGCFFHELQGVCLPCSGVVKECKDYVGMTVAFKKVCEGNPCNVPGGCEWSWGSCKPA